MWLIRHVVSALYPGSDRVPGAAALDLDGFLRSYRQDATIVMWVGLVLSTWIFVLSPVLTIGWPLPSFLLPKAALDRHTNRAMSHPWYVFRQLMFVVKLVGGLAWGQQAAVRAHFNVAPYPPDPGTWRSE